MPKISLIIPVYNLDGDRLNNLNFIFSCLSKVNLYEILVAEQSNGSVNIQETLTGYKNIKHIQVNCEDEYFNKALVINKASEITDGEFLWILDCDVYADYEFININITNEMEFVRPFSNIVLLNETETDFLHETHKININRKEYETNNANGKYSFIIKKKIFENSGRMNENFKGWGFQDLDFINNRLIECNKTYIDTLAFHMFHKPASKKYVNRNKRLFLNISKQKEIPTEYTINKKEKTIQQVTQNETKVITVKNTKKKKLEKKQKRTSVVEKINHHVHHMTKRACIFEEENILKIYKSDNHFLDSYFHYIINNYENLKDGFVFSTDLFSKTFTIFDKSTHTNIENAIKHGKNKFTWLSKQSKLRTTVGHTSFVKDKSYYKYDEWVSLYTEKVAKKSPPYSLGGTFYVSSKKIKQNSLEFYTRIHREMYSWVDEDYLFMLATLDNIFT